MLRIMITLTTLSTCLIAQERISMPIHQQTGLNIAYRSSKIGVCRYLGFDDYQRGSARILKDASRRRFRRSVKLNTARLNESGGLRKTKRAKVLSSIVCLMKRTLEYSETSSYTHTRDNETASSRLPIREGDDFIIAP